MNYVPGGYNKLYAELPSLKTDQIRTRIQISGKRLSEQRSVS